MEIPSGTFYNAVNRRFDTSKFYMSAISMMQTESKSSTEKVAKATPNPHERSTAPSPAFKASASKRGTERVAEALTAQGHAMAQRPGTKVSGAASQLFTLTMKY